MKPILFNTEMTKAILDGKKTVTRRVVKYEKGFARNIEKVIKGKCAFGVGLFDFVSRMRVSKIPPYKIGDVLWVRETWGIGGFNDDNMEMFITYRADDSTSRIKLSEAKYDNYYSGITGSESDWRPSIHMPKEAARIFLKVTDVMVERLQDTTEEQAIAEGVKAYGQNNCSGTSARIAFAELWDSTLPPNKNKFKCAENEWRTNPWVWVIEFERIEKGDAKE